MTSRLSARSCANAGTAGRSVWRRTCRSCGSQTEEIVLLLGTAARHLRPRRAQQLDDLVAGREAESLPEAQNTPVRLHGTAGLDADAGRRRPAVVTVGVEDPQLARELRGSSVFDEDQRMFEAAVSQVRSFNLLVTERVGALNDHDLAGDWLLGEARVLWQIGVDGREDVAGLLVAASASTRSSSPPPACPGARTARHRRNQRARPTASADGQAHRPASPSVTCWSARSDELARSFLEPLSASRRQRLVTAMAKSSGS